MREIKEIPITELRIIQRDLLYVSNLPKEINSINSINSNTENISKIDTENNNIDKIVINQQTLKSQNFFGQFGKIKKLVINETKDYLNAYITYENKSDCLTAITQTDETILGSNKIRCTFGTTKYCTFYLKNLKCQNIECMYLHWEGEEFDVLTLEMLKYYNTEFNKNLNKENISKELNTNKIKKNIVFHTFLGINRDKYFLNRNSNDDENTKKNKIIKYKKSLFIDELMVEDEFKKKIFYFNIFMPR